MPSQMPARNGRSTALVVTEDFKDDIVDQIRAGLIDQIASAVAMGIRGALGEVKVAVAAPQVNVTAPAVSVTPQVRVDADIPAASVTIDLAPLEGVLGRLASQLGTIAELSDTVEALIKLVQRPVVKRVKRDAQGFIESVTEQR